MWRFREEEQRGGGKFGPWGDAESIATGDDEARIRRCHVAIPGPIRRTPSAAQAGTKYRLVKVLAALDRGVAANDDDRTYVGDLVDQLEAAAKSTGGVPGGCPPREGAGRRVAARVRPPSRANNRVRRGSRARRGRARRA